MHRIAPPLLLSPVKLPVILKNIKSTKLVNLTSWQNFVATWDARRNNSWKTAFPDLIDCVQTT
jgi:hypothetical protein